MDSPPNVLYQYINIVPDINQDSIEAETILWIGYKDPVVVGSKIYLHCRQCRIKEVYVNNIAASYILNDALKSLAYDVNINNKKQSFLSEELDINYRAALELTRRGELEIIIPNEILNGTLSTPKPIPRSSPKDVIARYEKLLKIYNMLQSNNLPTSLSSSSKHSSNRNNPSSNQSPLSDNGSMDSSQISENEGKVRTNFIQIRIIYELSSKDSSSSGGETKSRNSSGYVFRHRPQLVELFEATLGKKMKSNIQKNKIHQATTLESIFTTVNSCGTLRDVDGIRCWLPCLDALDQRAVYDISITMPMNWKVSCCGKKLSTYLVQDVTITTTVHKDTNLAMIPLKISRFFTPNRIPAMSVGFFIGHIESYSMPLYKVKSRIWVAKGLNDFESKEKTKSNKEVSRTSCDVIKHEVISDNTTDEEAYTNDDEEKEDKIVFVKKLDGDYYASYKRRLNTDNTYNNHSIQEKYDLVVTNNEQIIAEEKVGEGIIHQESPPLKKIRTLPQATNDSSRKFYSMEAPNSKILSNNSNNIQSNHIHKENKSKNLYNKASRTSELYQEQVHHSTLGLDMALRLIHKFVNLKYDYEEYTLIFVHELGKDFMSFDGFALIDAKYLHSSQQVYIETTAHLVLIEAYLYSWIKSSLPICSYETEFIIHGTVGYLLNFYSEEVYGEEDGKYRYQKIYDTVIRLEMQGRGYPLSSFYPESFEVFNPYYGLYLKSKSTVLFHLIENRIGGKDPMRITLKHIIRSPPLHNSSQRHIKGTNNLEVINNFQSLFNASGISVSNATPPSPSMITSMLNEQYKQRQRSNSDDMSSNYSQAMSPYTMLGSGTPYNMSGNVSPYYLYNNQNENLSPYLKQQGNMSPYLTQGNMSPYSTAYGNMSPYPFYQSHGGNMSPYAAAAAAYAGGGSYTPAPYYDPYSTAAGAVYANRSYNPDRYEITHSPVIQTVEASVDNDENKVDSNENKQSVAVIDNSEIETNINEDKNTEKNTSSTANIIITSGVDESAISAMGGGYYATLARRDERIRSNSITVDHHPQPANPTSPTNRSRSNSISIGPHLPEEHSIDKSVAKSSSLNKQIPQASEASIAGNSEQILSLLTTDCTSADSFILAVKHASGASADIDNSFLDRYVYKSGVLFLRIHVSVSPKVDTKPRHIFVISQQVGMKQGGEVDNAYANEEVIKLRIAEARDDFVTEPMIRFCDISEQYQQQAYSRPGRRAGFRRTKAEITSNMTTEEITELARKEKILEERKSALQRARDIDYAIKYVVLDPSCLDIADVCNSSSDVLLIEQLYTDFYEHSVYFQCQALRSLARSAPSNEVIYIENKAESTESTTTTSTTSSSNPKLNSSIPEKSPKLQIKALCDCLLGLPTKIQDIKCIDGTQFCIYVRAEAAFALAQWQNENAPRSITSAMDSTSSSESHWIGMKALINILHELFIDPKTNIPLPSDFSNETFTYLRNAVLLAVSTIKAQSGITPSEVVETILLFNTDTIEEDMIQPIDNNNQIKKIIPKYDDTHYHAILFLALSNLRFDSITNISNLTTNSSISSTENKINHTELVVHPINKIISIAKNTINVAFTQARATARIKYRKNEANFLPYLPGNGIDVAAAISCLAEMDIQAIEMMVSGRSINTLDPRELEKPHPTGVGLLTKFDYLKYIFPPEIELKCAPRFLSPNYIPKDKNILKDKLSFCLCTPVIRAAAFEAFVRICFALQYGYIERLKSIHAKESLQSTQTTTNITDGLMYTKTLSLKLSDSTYIAATIEALLEILKQEGNLWLKQQAAIIISDTIMDRPARITIQSISINNYWYCFGNWSDPIGLTIVPHSIQHLLKPNTIISTNIKEKSIFKVGNGRKAMLSSGSNLKMAIKLYWRFIMMSANFDQTIRSVLANTWIYAFGKDVPRIIKDTKDELKQFSDNFFHNQLTEDRLIIRNPIEITNLINKSLKYGIIISKDNDNDNSDLTNIDTIIESNTTTNIATINTTTISNKQITTNKSNELQSATSSSSDQIVNKEIVDNNNVNIIKSPLKLTFTLNRSTSTNLSTSNTTNATNNNNNTANNTTTSIVNNTTDNIKQTISMNKPLGDKKTFRFVL